MCVCWNVMTNMPFSLLPSFFLLFSILYLNFVRKLCIVRRFYHDFHEFKRRVWMDRIPLYSVSYKIVVMRSILIISAVQITFKTVIVPPSSSIMFRAVVIETVVIVTVTCAEWHSIMGSPIWRQGIPRVSIITARMQTIIFLFTFYPEAVISGMVSIPLPVFHLNYYFIHIWNENKSHLFYLLKFASVSRWSGESNLR